MKLKDVKFEDYINYKKPCMFLIFPKCSFKCDKENGSNYCYNYKLCFEKDIEIPAEELVFRYLGNPLVHSFVCGGLEPFDSWEDLSDFVATAREKTRDDIVIYTGYYLDEIVDKIAWLKQYPNIIVKFGRFRPGQDSHLDEVLGTWLMNKEQYAVNLEDINDIKK